MYLKFDKQIDYDEKLEVLHNARQSFSKLKYDYPVKKQVDKVMERLDEIETYLKHWQEKVRKQTINSPVSTISEGYKKIIEWQSFLHGFISIATRWGIDWVYNSVKEGHEFSLIFEKTIFSAREKFDAFCISLRNEVLALEPKSHKMYAADIKGKFSPMIRDYCEWYEANKQYTLRFKLYNPYELMFNVIEATEHEILTFFPENNKSAIEAKPQEKVNTPETLLDIWGGTNEKYNKVIDVLKKDYSPIGMPFVRETSGKLYWLYKGRGWVQYLQAFIWKCYKCGLISEEGQLSAPHYQRILSTTFSLPSFDSKPFKSIIAKQPLDNYLKAFKSFDSL